MILPTVGELNERATLYRVESVPNGDWETNNERHLIAVVWAKVEVIGGSRYLDSINTESAVTHRVYVRYVKGFSSPLDLQQLTEIDIDGFTYRAKRITDVNNAHRFTLIECEQWQAVTEDGN